MTDDGVPGRAVPGPRRAPDDRPSAAAVPLARRAEPAPLGGSAVATIAPPWLRVPASPTDDRPTNDRPGRGRSAVVALVARDGRTLDRRRPVEVPPVVPRPTMQRARPRIEPEPSILGLSRITRGRVGSRVFTLFFVFVYALIAVQLVVTLLHG